MRPPPIHAFKVLAGMAFVEGAASFTLAIAVKKAGGIDSSFGPGISGFGAGLLVLFTFGAVADLLATAFKTRRHLHYWPTADLPDFVPYPFVVGFFPLGIILGHLFWK